MKSALFSAAAMFSLLVVGAGGCGGNQPSMIIRNDAGSGGSTATGSGGANASGGANGSGGTNGSGGAIGTGGNATGSGGTSGTDASMDVGGTETAGGTSGAICTPSGTQFDCNNVLKAADGKGMDGYANIDEATGPSQGSDAIQLGCTTSDTVGQQKIWKQEHWQLMGPGITMGTMYKVALHFYGVVECKSYVGGTGPASTASETLTTTETHNLWMTGSKDNGDHWNTYAFTVTPASLSTMVGIGPQNVPLPDSANTYVMNQCPGNRPEGHFTFTIDYDASITVPGGSFINYIEYDTNCRMIANCGAADAAQSCNGPYNLVPQVTKAIPNTNTMFTQPPANTANPPSRGQWWLVDVTNVTPM